MRATSYNLVLCAVFAALQVVFLLCAKYAGVASASFYVLSSCALMMPLTKKMYKESFLSYIAVSIIAFFSVGLPDCLIYITFSGAFTILSILLYEKKVNKVFAMLIKIIWTNLVFLALYLLFFSFVSINLSDYGISEIHYIVYVIAVSALTFLYDALMLYIYRNLGRISDRIFKR